MGLSQSGLRSGLDVSHKRREIGPYDLDNFWSNDLGFSKTQAVVLDLVKQQGISDKSTHYLDGLPLYLS